MRYSPTWSGSTLSPLLIVMQGRQNFWQKLCLKRTDRMSSKTFPFPAIRRIEMGRAAFRKYRLSKCFKWFIFPLMTVFLMFQVMNVLMNEIPPADILFNVKSHEWYCLGRQGSQNTFQHCINSFLSDHGFDKMLFVRELWWLMRISLIDWESVSWY